jgi:hypothetical protein
LTLVTLCARLCSLQTLLLLLKCILFKSLICSLFWLDLPWTMYTTCLRIDVCVLHSCVASNCFNVFLATVSWFLFFWPAVFNRLITWNTNVFFFFLVYLNVQWLRVFWYTFNVFLKNNAAFVFVFVSISGLFIFDF